MSVMPIDSFEAQRFCGVPTFMRLPQAIALKDLDAAIVDLPSDSGRSAAPAVQTPEAGGPSGHETQKVFRTLHSTNFAGCDVVGVNPLYDGPGRITPLMAATVMAEFLGLLASKPIFASG
jgi:Arginase family